MEQILVVEDDAPLCWLIERMLRGKYIVRLINNGLDAISWLQQGNKCDIIITDQHLPGVNGLELLQYVKQSGLRSNTPVIVLSALAVDGDTYIDAGAFAYILKPVDPQKLMLEIRTILSGRQVVTPQTI